MLSYRRVSLCTMAHTSLHRHHNCVPHQFVTPKLASTWFLLIFALGRWDVCHTLISQGKVLEVRRSSPTFVLRTRKTYNCEEAKTRSLGSELASSLAWFEWFTQKLSRPHTCWKSCLRCIRRVALHETSTQSTELHWFLTFGNQIEGMATYRFS